MGWQHGNDQPFPISGWMDVYRVSASAVDGPTAAARGAVTGARARTRASFRSRDAHVWGRRDRVPVHPHRPERVTSACCGRSHQQQHVPTLGSQHPQPHPMTSQQSYPQQPHPHSSSGYLDDHASDALPSIATLFASAALRTSTERRIVVPSPCTTDVVLVPAGPGPHASGSPPHGCPATAGWSDHAGIAPTARGEANGAEASTRSLYRANSACAFDSPAGGSGVGVLLGLAISNLLLPS